jgi:hypothetical protein
MTAPLIVLIAQLGQLISGLQKNQPNGTIVIDGTSYTTTELIQLLQALIDALSSTVAARTAYRDAVHQSDALLKTDGPTVTALKASLRITYGPDSSTLSQYGLSPRKVTVRTAEEKAIAAEKARATRAARHTMGKKAKKAITGATASAAPTVTAPAGAPAPAAPSVTVTPVTSGTAATSLIPGGATGH